jgi:hypothetical protein
LRYQLALPPSIMTPWTMPSPRNQCGEKPGLGFEPFRTYRPASSGGKVPSTFRSNVSVSRVTGAKSPRSHHGFERSTTVVDVGTPRVVGAAVVTFERALPLDLPPHAARIPAPPSPAVASAPRRSNVRLSISPPPCSTPEW